MIDLIKPHIVEGSEREMLLQIRSYLYQMSEQLQNAFVALQGGAGGGNYFAMAGRSTSSKNGYESKEKSPQQSFNELKALIINSADIVNAYSDKINKQLKDEYLAKSDFGEYREQTKTDISANAKNITIWQEATESIRNDFETFQSSFNGYIKIGRFEDEGDDAMGVEIGQSKDAETTMRSRFTAQRLVFLGADGKELGYFKGNFLYLSGSMQIDGDLRMRKYTVDNSYGLSVKYNG